jgi:hypothetical protein
VCSSDLKLKGRFDWVCTKRHIIVDLKTINDASQENAMRDGDRYKYYWQAYFYCLLYEIAYGARPKFFFVYSENAVPHEVAVDEFIDCEGSVLDLAELEIRPLIDLYKNCLKNNQWLGYGKRKLGMSPWQFSRYQNLTEEKGQNNELY